MVHRDYPCSFPSPKFTLVVPHRCIATLQHDLSRRNISIGLVPALRAFVYPFRQILLACMRLASRTSLASAIWIYLGKVCTSLKAHFQPHPLKVLYFRFGVCITDGLINPSRTDLDMTKRRTRQFFALRLFHLQ